MALKRLVFNGVTTNYMVSTFGKVYSIKDDNSLYELKFKTDKDGYKKVTIYVNHKPYERGVHRIVALAFIPNPLNKPEVNHKNGNKDDNSVVNLEWVTTKENIAHAWKNNLSKPKKCEKHPNSVYTNDQIIRVCELLVTNQYTMKEISEKTNVSYTVVKQIKNRIIWKEISKDYDFGKFTKSRKTILCEDQVRRICEMITKKIPIEEISDLVGVPIDTIQHIHERKIWTRISDKYLF